MQIVEERQGLIGAFSVGERVRPRPIWAAKRSGCSLSAA